MSDAAAAAAAETGGTLCEGSEFVDSVYGVVRDYCFDMLRTLEDSLKQSHAGTDEGTIQACIDDLALHFQRSLDKPLRAFEEEVTPLFDHAPKPIEQEQQQQQEQEDHEQEREKQLEEEEEEQGAFGKEDSETVIARKQLQEFQDLQAAINSKAQEVCALQQMLQQRQAQIQTLTAQLEKLNTLSLASLGKDRQLYAKSPAYVERIKALQRRTAELQDLVASVRR